MVSAEPGRLNNFFDRTLAQKQARLSSVISDDFFTGREFFYFHLWPFIAVNNRYPVPNIFGGSNCFGSFVAVSG